MVEEIIYTSAEKGLKQGSRGFCTVVSTSGMALNIAERLESMSGYRQAFPLNDPQSSLNPVNYSHVTMRLAGKILHVLSRVADAGQDYTGRSNKLAHHIVINSVGNLTPGPARLLADAGVIKDRWDGVVRHVPPRELPTPSVPSTIQLSAWKAICGDGGWAGSIAEQLLQNPAPLSVIFDVRTDTLSLVREVLDLVPAPQRWNVTFSTYFTRLLAGAECQLRFVLNDTPEATALRNDARARVVDLTKPLPAATGGALVTIARSGVLTPQEPAPVAPATRTAIQPKEPAAAASPKAAVLPALPRFGQPTIGDGAVVLPEIPFPANRSPRKLKLVVALLLFTTVTGTLAATVMFLGKAGKPDKFSEIVSNTVPANTQQPIEDRKAIEEQAARERKEAEDKQRGEQLAAEEAEKQKRAADMAAAENAAADETRKEAEAKALALDAEWEEKGPFVFIRNDEHLRDSHGQWLFELPKPGESNAPDPLPLSINDKVVELAFCPGAEHLFPNPAYRLTLVQSPDDPDKWIAKGDEIELAEYTIQRIDATSGAERSPDRHVHFRWLENAKRETAASELLRWWPLQIDVGDKSAVLLQRKAVFLSTPLSWKTLVDSNDFTFPKSDELKAVTLNQHSHVNLELQITQKGHEPQNLTLKIGDDESADEGDDDQYAEDSPNSEVQYFPLTLPLKFVDARPSDAADSLGFGTLKIRLSYDEKKGLIFQPKMAITVRLPKKDLLNSFPSAGMLEQLTQLSKDPTLFRNIASHLVDMPPDKVSIFTVAEQEMMKNAHAMRTDVATWHIQPLAKLLGKKSFDSTFEKRATAATNTVRGVIPEFKRTLQAEQNKLINVIKANSDQSGVRKVDPASHAAIDAQAANVKAAETNFSNANKYAPDVQTFTTKMQQLTKEVDRQILELIKDYDAISDHIKAFEDEAQQGHFQVQSQLSGHVETLGSENPEGMTVYFVESLPEVGSR